MDQLQEVVAGIGGFDAFKHSEKLRFFAWYLHTAQDKQHIKVADFRACFVALHLPLPSNLHSSVDALTDQQDLILRKEGYGLSKRWRDHHQQKYGSRPITVQVHDALMELPEKVSVPTQKEYLDEALRCFRVQSWRAAALMAWNLAYDHLCQVIVLRGLVDFAAEYNKRHARKPVSFSQRSDLQEVNEREVIEIAKAVAITDKTQHSCLDRNLGVRNSIAHPSGFDFKQPQAETFILEVVQTIVLGLK